MTIDQVVWISASAPTGRSAGGAASARPGEKAVVVPRLSKVTPKMGWGKLKTKAVEDQQVRVQERGPMDVNQMLNVWKKGAPMKARMSAMFSKAKSMGGMLRRSGSVQPVEKDVGAEGTGGPSSAPTGGKRSLKSVFGQVKTATMLGSTVGKYAAPDSGDGKETNQQSTRSLKGVFTSARNANRLASSPSGSRSAWGESSSANPPPGEMRDDEEGSSSRCEL